MRITSDPPAAAGESRSWKLITDPPDPVVVYHFDHFNPQTSPVVASWPLLCPRRPELGAALLLRPLSECLVPGPGHADAGLTAVTGLTRSGAPLGPIAHLGLLTALGSAEASVRIAAADVWIQAALTSRLDADLAADALVQLVTGEAVKLTRLADGLRHASREPASGAVVAIAAAAPMAASAPAMASRPASSLTPGRRPRQLSQSSRNDQGTSRTATRKNTSHLDSGYERGRAQRR